MLFYHFFYKDGSVIIENSLKKAKGEINPRPLSPCWFCVTIGTMKAKKIILSSLAVASAGALAAGVYKIAKDQKRLRTQEELVAEVREQMEAMGTIATLYVELYESSEERLVGGVIFEDERHYRFVYEDGLLHYEEEKLWSHLILSKKLPPI